MESCQLSVRSRHSGISRGLYGFILGSQIDNENEDENETLPKKARAPQGAVGRGSGAP
jgi:hypothetical protein